MESSSKRACKAPGSNITQVAHCLADGCTADLSLCRDYHRRHKVCEVHSKTPKVTIAGREQRFCQQCSRFHSLVEFDEGKRSCRKRLDGHNRRRRKPPQPESLHRNSGLIFSPQPPAGRLLSFSSPLATNSILSSSWTGAVKSETDMMLYNNHHHQQQPPMNYSSFPEQSYKAVNQLHFQFINTNNQDYLDPNDRKMFPADVVDSDRALSLLSPPPPPPDPVHNYFHHYPFEDQESSKPVVSSTNSPSSLHVPGMMFPSAGTAASEGSSSTASGSHQTLTFMWE